MKYNDLIYFGLNVTLILSQTIFEFQSKGLAFQSSEGIAPTVLTVVFPFDTCISITKYSIIIMQKTLPQKINLYYPGNFDAYTYVQCLLTEVVYRNLIVIVAAKCRKSSIVILL